jgi:hypothetical protein
MLIRMQGGYVNLATIIEAELNEDESVTLHWNARSQNYTGLDAATLRQVLENLAGNMRRQDIVATPLAQEEEEGLDRAWETESRDAASESPFLKMHTEPSRPRSATVDANAELPSDDETAAEDPKQHSALSRRVAQVMSFEPIASLSHKLRGVFLAAIDKATDFNHLAPKHRRLIQEAEACRRAHQRQ